MHDVTPGARSGVVARTQPRAAGVTDVHVAQMDAARVGAPDPEIVTLEARLRAAQLAGDIPALAALIADDLLFTGPDGELASKEVDLATHASGAVRFVAHEPDELRIRRVGVDVAITALRARLVVETGGTRMAPVVRYTRVWAREADGAWRVIAGHVAAVPSATSDATPDTSTP